MTTTPAKPTRSRKAAPVSEPVVETTTGRKSAKLAVVPEPVVEPETKRSFADTPEAAELIVLNDEMLAAVEAFEARVIELITSGVSPTTIGKCVDRGNSSIRRIAMRRSPGLVK